MSTHAYLRVSTQIQADHGQSLETQEAQIRAFCVLQDLQVTKIHIDRAVSGSKPIALRPAGAEMFAMLGKGDVIVASRLDRMFRSALDALSVLKDLQDRGISLYLIDLGGDVTGDGIAKIMFTLLSAFAEFERDKVIDRVRAVKADQKRRGRYRGGKPPFGYRAGPDGDLIPHAGEQEAIRGILQLHAEGDSLRAISERCHEEGYELSHQAVSRILRDSIAAA